MVGNPDVRDDDNVGDNLSQSDKHNPYLSSPSDDPSDDGDEDDHGNEPDNMSAFDNNNIFDFSGSDDDDDADANINDFAADKYNFNQRIHHYMEYSEISARNLRAVEYCCMTQANTIVCNNQTKGKKVLDDMQLKEYLTLVSDIPDSYFVNHTIKAGMLDGYVGMRGGGKNAAVSGTGKKPPIAAAPFARKQKKVVGIVRYFASNFPGAKDYKDLPSGKGLRDIKIEFIVKVWKAEKIKQNKAGDVSIMI